MFASKSSQLLSWVDRAAVAQQRCLLVKHAADTRYTQAAELVTHSGIRQSSQSNVEVVVSATLGELDVSGYRLVAVDEGQFYPDLAAACSIWADAGLVVVVAALDGDFRRRLFPAVGKLLPLCDTIVKHCAICARCRSRNAPFSARIVEGDSQVQVGAAESYIAMCRQCFRHHRYPGSVEELEPEVQAYACRLGGLYRLYRRLLAATGLKGEEARRGVASLINRARPVTEAEIEARTTLSVFNGKEGWPVHLSIAFPRTLRLPPGLKVREKKGLWRLESLPTTEDQKPFRPLSDMEERIRELRTRLRWGI